jgi:uracil-DNA glycosylase family protein
MARETTSVISAADFLPARRTLPALVAAAAHCEGCPLFARATQTVFGEGPDDARIIMVGEQPGDQEDLQGKPFVGPAGALLDRALADAKIDRTAVYVTNAVKHFKWTPRGKRRIHQRPNRTEIVACHQWLARELDLVHDDAPLVTLGAVAGESLFGGSFRVGASRGQVLVYEGRPVVATIHPSAVLRSQTSEEREAAFEGFVADLARAWDLAG